MQNVHPRGTRERDCTTSPQRCGGPPDRGKTRQTARPPLWLWRCMSVGVGVVQWTLARPAAARCTTPPHRERHASLHAVPFVRPQRRVTGGLLWLRPPLGRSVPRRRVTTAPLSWAPVTVGSRGSDSPHTARGCSDMTRTRGERYKQARPPQAERPRHRAELFVLRTNVRTRSLTLMPLCT